MKKTTVFIVMLILIIGCFLGYKYLYQGHRNIANEAPEFTLTVKQLHDEFVTNDTLANQTYSNQTIEVDGTVTAFDAATKTVTIDEKLSAVFKKKLKTPLNPGTAVSIKGRFVGYDDLLEELKMDQAMILN